jgi:hypothetical protein
MPNSSRIGCESQLNEDPWRSAELRCLADRWAGLPEPALEWSVGVTAGECVRRRKWVAWTGPSPCAGPEEMMSLCRDVTLAHLLSPYVDADRIRNLGIGVDGQRPVCLYVDQAANAGRPRLLKRIGPRDTVEYTFHRLPATAGGPTPLSVLPDRGRRLAARLLEDPVVRTSSGFWLRSDQQRVYLTFPHHPPVWHLQALLGDELDITGLAEHDHHHFRHVCVHGAEQLTLTVYLSGHSAVFPASHADLRARVATWARTVYESEAAQELVRRAELAARCPEAS